MTSGSRSKNPGLVWMVTHPMSAEILMRDQLRYLNENGFRVDLFSAPGPELERTGRREGIRYHAIPMPKDLGEEQRSTAINRIAEGLERIQPTIAIAGTTVMGYLGILAAQEVGVPVRIYYLNGLPVETAEGPARDVLYEMEAASTEAAHQVICISRSLQRRYSELGLDPSRKTVVLSDGSSGGVDTRRFRPPLPGEGADLRGRFGLPASAPVVGWVGRLAEVKGIPDLADAFIGPVLEDHPDAFLLLVGGPDPYSPVSDELMALLEDHPRIRMTGHLAEPAPAYRVMDVLACPSSREGFSGACLEAASTAVPAVGYRVTGVVDTVVDGVTGSLVEPGNPDELGRTISRYLSDPVARSLAGARGRQRVVAKFTQERVWRELREALEQLMADLASDSVDALQHPVVAPKSLM